MSESVIIRPWDQTERELALLSAMNRRVHIHQFFDNNGPLGGKLGNEFPTLKPYQSDQDFFKRIWENLAQSFNRQSNASYIYTAYKSDDPEEKPVGFVKGSEWDIDDATRELLPENAKNSIQISCLGSLYIAPEMQGMRIGRLLTSAFAQEACKRGYTSMVTHAYAGNTSPRFFIEKTGATHIGQYSIPNFFDNDLLERNNLKRDNMPDSIPGVALFWDEQHFSDLLTMK